MEVILEDINGYKLMMTKQAEKQYMKMTLENKRMIIKHILGAYTNGSIELQPPLKSFKFLKRISHKGGMRILIEINPQNRKEHLIRRIDDRKQDYQFLKHGYNFMFQ